MTKHVSDHVDYLPRDYQDALFVGRVETTDGPSVVVVKNGVVTDITSEFPTVSDLLELEDPVAVVSRLRGRPMPSLGTLFANSLAYGRASGADRFLSPCDLQAIKASGVTFAVSLIERLIEEQANGDAQKAGHFRQEIHQMIGSDLSMLVPGSSSARALEADLKRRGLWSQYLEVGIGPDAEIFTKAQPMSAVGFGNDIGLLASSEWNNPEPEIVLVVNSRGEIVGATLGNDVNLRDLEGRSALLLGKAKDNNGSCAIGPLIRLFDSKFTLDTIREAKVSLRIDGVVDGFELTDESDMCRISRDPAMLVAQTLSPNHQYPDGLVLFLGTMFTPTKDRFGNGSGFTHRKGDVVTISSPSLGTLVNRVGLSNEIPEWTMGVRGLYQSLAARGISPYGCPMQTKSC